MKLKQTVLAALLGSSLAYGGLAAAEGAGSPIPRDLAGESVAWIDREPVHTVISFGQQLDTEIEAREPEVPRVDELLGEPRELYRSEA